MSKINDAVEQALVDAFYWIEERNRLNRTVSNRLQDQYRHDKEVAEATSVLNIAMYRRESDAWQRAMMFGLGLPKKARVKLKEAVHARMFGEDDGGTRSVMHLLEQDGKHPGSYLVQDDKDFREEIRGWLEGDGECDEAPADDDAKKSEEGDV